MAIRITRAGVALTVGIILVTGLIIGGLFLVKNQGEQARRDDAINIAEQNLEEQSDEGVALNEGEGNTETSQNEETESQQSAGSSEATEQVAASELPATGPADTAAALFVVGLLTFASVSYYQSRKLLL